MEFRERKHIDMEVALSGKIENILDYLDHETSSTLFLTVLIDEGRAELECKLIKAKEVILGVHKTMWERSPQDEDSTYHHYVLNSSIIEGICDEVGVTNHEQDVLRGMMLDQGFAICSYSSPRDPSESSKLWDCSIYFRWEFKEDVQSRVLGWKKMVGLPNDHSVRLIDIEGARD